MFYFGFNLVSCWLLAIFFMVPWFLRLLVCIFLGGSWYDNISEGGHSKPRT